MEDPLTVIISAIIGAVVSYIGALIQNFLDMRTTIDKSLRDDRIKVYKVLWKKTELLPKWPKATDVTYEKLAKLSEELRDWYFSEGGVYLSTEARKVYGDLQETLNQVSEKHKSGTISEEHYEMVRENCSKLRTELTKDLLSRRRAFLVS